MRKDGTWYANPAPYNRKITLTNQEDNDLNLHLTESRSKQLDSSAYAEPCPDIIDADSAYLRLGNVRSMNKSVTLQVQREIVRFVIGTHQTLIKH